MSRPVLIIADKDDVHAQAVRNHLPEQTPVFWFDGFEYRDCWKISWRYIDGAECCATFSVGGRALDIVTVGGVLYRGYQSPPLPVDYDEKADSVDKAEHEDAFWGALTSASKALWINNPLCQKELLLKINQLNIAKNLGLTIPATLITNSPAEAHKFISQRKAVVCKLLSHEFYGTAVSDELAVYTSVVTPEIFSKRHDDIALCPTLLQEKIDKICDIRVNVIGEDVYSAAIFSQEHDESKTDFRLIGNLLKLRTEEHDLPNSIKNACIKMLTGHGLYFGAFDFALTDNGQYVFFEVNLTGNWLWLEYLLKFPISQTIAQSLIR